jgi:hypothetical protein
MNPEIKARWVAALRSGEYQQTTGNLRTENGFCCLGVLCDLHSKATGIEWAVDTYGDYFYGDTEFYRRLLLIGRALNILTLQPMTAIA